MTSLAQDKLNHEWNAMAGEWDDLASGYRDEFIKVLWRETQLDPGEKRIVIDFGCGSGLLTESMRNRSLESQFFCIDAASSMIREVQNKIRSGEWENVKAYCVALSNYEEAGEQIKADLDSLRGRVDLVVASSVINFIPTENLSATMKVLGAMLKSGGLFCHSDWLKSDDNPEGLTAKRAQEVYAMGGITKKSSTVVHIGMGCQKGDVFVGVAVKK
jgi:2-polyprenyl-3-methyl-5-hydroxy-6-metoxy-1,4-benzoquinol methylase